MDGLDPSIYQNAYNPQPITPVDPVGSIQKAYGLADMALQHSQMLQQVQGQQVSRWALAKNTDPTTGKLDQQGALADINKINPTLGLTMGNQFAAANKAQAEAQAAQTDAASKAYNIIGPKFDYMAGLPENQRAAVYPQIVQQMKDQGADVSKLDHPYDPGLFSQYYSTWNKSKEAIGNHLAQAETEQKSAEAAKLRSETIKQNPNPGDPNSAATDPAQLVPGKVPQTHQAKALEEIKNSQDIVAMAPKALDAFDRAAKEVRPMSGGLGGTSPTAFVPGMDSAGQKDFIGLMGTTVKETEGTSRAAAFAQIEKKFSPQFGDSDATIASKRQGVLDYMSSHASAPTAKAYGIDLSKYASTAPYKDAQKTAGSAPSGNSAYASDRTGSEPQYRKAGASVSADQVAQYATKHGIKASEAKDYLRSQGYAVGN